MFLQHNHALSVNGTIIVPVMLYSRVHPDRTRHKGGRKMGAVTVNSLGETSISDEVLAMLAGISAIECYGIVGMAW